MLASIRTLGVFLPLSVCLLSAIALAQSRDKPLEISIPAGNLADALERLGNQAGLQIMYEPEVAKGITVAAVSGTLTANEALRQLLAKTRLKADRVNDKTVVLRKAEVEKKPEPIKAQKDQPSAANRPSSESSDLQEIVVTAQKREQRLQDVPISLTVLSGKALDNSTTQSIFDDLNRVPGVVILPVGGQSTGATQIAIRGVAASGYTAWEGSSPVAYYLDTVPFGFVRSAFIPDSSAFDLARVEVLRGPQGTLYGANAEDGVVRVISNGPDFSGFDLKARIVGSATDGGGANGGGDVAVNVPLIEGKLAVRAVVGYQDWSGWIDRPNENNSNDSQQRNYRLKIGYQPTDALSVDLSLWSARDHFNAPATGLPNGTSPNSGTTAEPISNRFDAYGAKIGYQFAHVQVTSMTSYLSYSDYAASDLTPYGFNLLGLGDLSLQFLAQSKIASEELLLNSVDTGLWQWTAGAFYRDDRDHNRQIVVPANIGYVDFTDKSRSYAIFGQIGRKFLDGQFEWTLGLRQFRDEVSTEKNDPAAPASYLAESFNATTPRAVLSWYPSSRVTVYSSFSEGFRSGMPQYYATTQIDSNIPAASPDKLYNYEVGTKADLFDHHLAIDAAAYYVRWKGVQQNIGVPYPGAGFLTALVNGPSASGPGIDLAVTVRPTQNLQIGGTLSWNKLTMDRDVISNGEVLFNKGDRLVDSSQYTGSLFANYTVALGGGTLGEFSLSGNYISKQAQHAFDVNTGLPFTNYGDDLIFVQSDFTVTFPEHWSVKLFGDNLTNRSGSIVGPPSGYGPNTAELLPRPRPRTIGLELDYRFK